MTRVAIVGGGPGGLFTNYLLDRFCDGLFTATLFEASDRLGGKIITDRFEKGNSLFERGVAEYYDYSHFGPDPLKRIITEVMELDVVPMDGKHPGRRDPQHQTRHQEAFRRGDREGARRLHRGMPSAVLAR